MKILFKSGATAIGGRAAPDDKRSVEITGFSQADATGYNVDVRLHVAAV